MRAAAAGNIEGECERLLRMINDRVDEDAQESDRVRTIKAEDPVPEEEESGF